MDGSSHLLAGAICETVFLPNRRNIWTLWGRLTTGCLPELGKLPQKALAGESACQRTAKDDESPFRLSTLDNLPHGTSASRMLN
jgi:hypothetical protein